jgi:hypothetical protein
MRFRLVLSGLFLLTQGAVAEPTRDEVMSGAARCAGIADNRVWLDCFYGSAQPMRSLLNLPPAPNAQIKLVPPPGAAYQSSESPRSASRTGKPRGFFAELLGSTKPVATDMPMASYRFERNGTFTVVLKNGQTYRQEESDLVRAKWNSPAASYLVTITGSSDIFQLRVKNEPGVLFRVRRI